MRPYSVIYDVLYGFIPITEWEEKIISSPFFQRLRWIRQLGFASYTFPGAEHNRFSHVIGVMHSMHQMVKALGIGVSDEQLFNRKAMSPQATLHKSLRIAALLHDIGTFPFSHAIEFAYIRHGNDRRSQRANPKELPNSHEHLGSFIIKNTPYEGGLTRILMDYGFDVQQISDIIKGDSKFLIANQLMHSDLDADRFDYLMRDSHYTGVKYGQFDRDYILANLTTFQVGRNQMGFGVREGALQSVEDFLIARFNWYSQVIKAPGPAKFDILASHIAKSLLDWNLIFQFHDLLSMIENRGERFFWFNDNYLINKCQEIRYNGLMKDPMVSQWIEMLLYRKAPKTILHPLFSRRLLSGGGADQERKKLVAQIHALVDQMNDTLKKHGTGKEWILVDIPEKDVAFTSHRPQKHRKTSAVNLFEDRDPIKIVSRSGAPSLLAEQEHSLMKHLAGIANFMPNVYANDQAISLLRAKKMIP